MKVRGCMFKLTLGLAAIILFGFIPQVFANEDNSISTSDIIALVEQLGQEGQFANEGAFRAVKMHLTAVHHFEQQEETDKVVQHMNGFKMLIERQLDNEMISDQAHDALSEKTADFIAQLTAIPIVFDGQANAVIIAPEDPDDTNMGVPGWDYRNAASPDNMYVVDTKSYSGYHSLYVDDQDGNAYGLISHRIYENAEGEAFTARAMTFLESGDKPNFMLRFYDARGNTIASFNQVAGIEGEWKEVSLSGTAPAGTVSFGFYIFADGNGTRSFYVDDVELKRVGEEENLLTNPGFEKVTSSSTVDTLVEYIQKSTGVELPVLTSEPSSHDGVSIYIGHSRAENEERHQALLQELNEHGFILDTEDDHITIRGTTERATEFGIYDFLERYLGVRWLMPGPDGEHVPHHDILKIPQELVVEEPATVSRHFFGLNDKDGADWGARNRMHHNIQFHHNMSELFDPEVFADHPEYYADGEVPTHEYSWQPCFNEVTAEVAIDRIIEYFNNNPHVSSYSLGINDGTNYCEKEGHPDYPDETNSVGRLHRSDLYYRWVNQIAEGVTEVHPDKYLGLLAYREMQDPPKNEDGTYYKLHPNVIPYITLDRLLWADPSHKQAGHDHLDVWKESAENLGWYDYMYGAAYSLPRVYFHTMAESYQYASEQGIIGHVAELYPNFGGEGPKGWVSAKLQWDPDQDVDQLLNDWYTSAVGEDAAPYLQQYYEFWEQFWTEQILDSNWFSNFNGIYLNFNDLSYLLEVTREEMDAAKQLLQQVVEHAGPGKQQVRAEKFLLAFDYYESSVLSYPVSGIVEVPTNEEDALAMLDRVIESYEMAERRNEIREEFQPDPILRMYGRNRGTWDGIMINHIAALEDYVTENPGSSVEEQLDEFLNEIGYVAVSANAVKTTASKVDILQTLDFSQGPWTAAEPFNNFYIMDTNNSPTEETNVYLLWDDENLYVGYENFEKNLSEMIVSDEAPNGWWSSGADDSVETFVTGNPEEEYLGFFTNPKAVKFARYQRGLAPGVEWEANADIGTDRWNAVQVIPFAEIDVDPSEADTIQAIFFRNYHGHTEFIGWDGAAPWRGESFRPVNLIE